MKKNPSAAFVLALAVILASCGGTVNSSSGSSSSEESTSSTSSSSSASSSSSTPSSSPGSSEPVVDVTGSGSEFDPYVVNTRAGLESIRPAIEGAE